MDLNALKAAVQGSTNIAAPAASPNSTGANAFAQAAIGNIQNLAQSDYQVASGNAASNQLSGGLQSNEDARQASAAEEAARRKEEMKKLQEKIDAYSDPKKYQKIINETGGYSYFDPDGEEITAQDYSKITNQHLTDVLKDSQNTQDQEFVQDYKEIQKIGQFVQAGDKEGYKKYIDKDENLKKYMKDNNINTYADLVKGFRTSYPQYFSPTSQQNVGDGTFNSYNLQDNRGIVDKLKSTLGLAPKYQGF